MKSSKIYGILLFVMFVWGVNVSAMKYLTMDAAPISMSAIRILLASIVVFLLLKPFGLVRRLTTKEWGYVWLGGLLNVALHHALMSSGLSLTSGANTSLIIGTTPLVTAVLSSFLLRTVPNALQWIGLVLGLSGIAIAVIFSGDGTQHLSWGDAFIFFSITSQALSFIVILKAKRTIDPRLLTAYMFLVGAIMLAISGVILEPNGFATIPFNNLTFVAVLIGSGAVATALGHMLYNYAVGQVGPTKAAIFINLNTFFALASAAILLGEPVGWPHYLGLLLVVAGVIFGSGIAEHWLKKSHIES